MNRTRYTGRELLPDKRTTRRRLRGSASKVGAEIEIVEAITSSGIGCNGGNERIVDTERSIACIFIELHFQASEA